MRLGLTLATLLFIGSPGFAFASKCEKICARQSPEACKARCKKAMTRARDVETCFTSCTIRAKDCVKSCEAVMQNRNDPTQMQAALRAAADKRAEKIQRTRK